MTVAPVDRPRIHYSSVLSTAWAIFAKHKIVWLLGILAALLGRNDYGGTVNFSVRYSSGNLLGLLPDLSNNPLLRGFNENPWPYAIGAAIVGILLWLVILFLGSLAVGTLIAYVGDAIREPLPSLAAAWARGQQRVWALWAATLLLTVVPLFAFATVFICAFASILTPMIGMTNANAESEVIASVLVNLGLFLIPAICIVVPATILFSLLVSLTAPAVVLGGRNALAAIGQAFRLLFRFFGWVLLTWLMLTGIGIVVGAVVTVPAMALWLGVSRASIAGVWTPLDILLLAAALGFSVVVGIGLGGVLTGFSTTLWAVLYDAMAGLGGSSAQTTSAD